MANIFFKFKQFTVHQEHCAMKVCTDACLFGAINANEIIEYKNALDIGTGTGLLSLMYAQKHYDCKIDAIEIDEMANKQGIENSKGSLFKHQISFHFDDIRSYSKTSLKKYGLIFSNPPFYANDLKSNDDKRNIAMHGSLLSYTELFKIASNLLDDDGKFFILIPFTLEEKVLETAEKNILFIIQMIRVKQTTSHNYFRSIICFSKTKLECKYSEISIKDETNNYTPEFKLLLKDYYLHL